MCALWKPNLFSVMRLLVLLSEITAWRQNQDVYEVVGLAQKDFATNKPRFLFSASLMNLSFGCFYCLINCDANSLFIIQLMNKGSVCIHACLKIWLWHVCVISGWLKFMQILGCLDMMERCIMHISFIVLNLDGGLHIWPQLFLLQSEESSGGVLPLRPDSEEKPAAEPASTVALHL